MIRAPELQTHLGRAANQIAAGGLNEGLTIIARKLAMNLKLIVILSELGVYCYITGYVIVGLSSGRCHDEATPGKALYCQVIWRNNCRGSGGTGYK